MSRTPRIAIVGAGLGGLALGVKLKQVGVHSFVIFEKSNGPGGTWWENRYPGAACDVDASLYSYSFMQYDWTRTHPSQEEILGYIRAVIDRFGLGEHLQYGTAVNEVVWDEERHGYTVYTERGDAHEFDLVVSAVGMLNTPRYPDWPGLDEFEGPKFHTARWQHGHDLTGLRVAVVGTGSTAAQVVPAIAPSVGQLYVFQREPGWILPKAERDYTAAERARSARWSILSRYERARLYIGFERLRSAAEPTSKAQAKLREMCLQHIAASIEDPELRAVVTPDHHVWCKRPILANAFYRALNRDNVELVPQPVTRATRTALVDGAGTEREIDALVMATGFRATDYLSTVRIKGRDGRCLHETWDSEPSAFLGLAMPGFPNFFMLYGPGTNGGSIIFKLERQAEWVIRVIRRMQRRSLIEAEVRPTAYRHFNRWLDRANAEMAWQAGCNNYFAAPSGRVVTQWPGTMTLYWLMARTLNRVAMTSVSDSAPATARAS